jgi:hypothetical protein
MRQACWVAGWRSPRTRVDVRQRKRRGPCARPLRVGLLRTRCSWCYRVAGVGATALRCWVLHGGGPLRCGGVCPSAPFQGRITSVVSLLAGLWVDAAFVLDLLCRCCEWWVPGRVDVLIRPAGEYSRAVTCIDVPIQPGEFLFFFSFLFLLMISQDCSLVFFFRYINESRTILRGLFKKTRRRRQ